MNNESNSLKSIIYALTANVSIALIKFAAAFYTGSGAMLAEAIHSLVDSSNQVLLMIGLKSAKRPPSSDFPLGYGKAIYFWSFIVAVMLFSMGGLFSIYEGWHKLLHPTDIRSPLLAIAVLAFSVCAEGLAFAGCIREINKERGDLSFYKWFRETRKSEFLVIFGEDFAALIGLSFALLAISLSLITENPIWDAIGTLGIGCLLIVVAIFISIEVKALLIGQGVAPQDKQKMLEFLQGQESIDTVFNILTYQLGPDVLVALKVKMKEQGSERALIVKINEVEKAFKEKFPEVLWLFFEPDIKD